ncbi:MAG: RdgB/HAM1 family non-canonical purine NTP pyrophosphatase [Candidatus Marinimicrobia bacterium]|jgi:XTP/dITP diphosphohydrolase|nr:RdgB/HAM1 family non-canonical purine NTP pyrophosphatase [Candidatus Neomarinimicrobiota bacterium]MBT3631008.1 RdgB/HAM1 family non-canonical purine NTP pyrophosphatase [Candidatus Neomarinimicrobiota bacterium]MBT3824145.1 RdgB/HAM1 family non-canonical purine NTP pyrophosphatase [Candidatus Neomarinimicrobiota bacterium]MBT4130383.1 RdgB/HAM1 family non-canonical purine NTP pyrophosphatase [Candidatus Neomarinimicrobiota bacterium]MBT4295612.1 RdgB/HAM1 family non-canonical purine NTP py
MKLLLATQNKHKVEELTRLMQPYAVEIVSLLEYPEIGEIVEDGDTLEANALIKARAGYAHCGIPTIADDTGLAVDALDGAPGVYAARYAGENVTYDENVQKMLNELSEVPIDQRQAQFQTAAVFFDGTETIVGRGEVPGMITTERQGNSGFGYDPIFYIPEKQQTYAQMDLEEKNKLSHRKRAFAHLIDQLSQTHRAFKVELNN